MIQFHMLDLILSRSGLFTLEAGFYVESLFTDTGFIIELVKNFSVEYVILSRSLTSHFHRPYKCTDRFPSFPAF